MNAPLRTIPLALLTVFVLGIAGCGGSTSTPTDLTSETGASATDETTGGETDSAEPASTTTSVSDACSDVETFDVEPTGQHEDREFTIDDYATNPPTGGDHNPSPIETGQFYSDAPRLGEVVHALEHGAVIGWTNGLSEEDQTAVEDAFNQMYGQGYYQLAVVEFPDLDGSFALSSWDSLQHCESIDPAAITDFIENHYAPSTTAEALLACTGKAQRLPACKEL